MLGIQEDFISKKKYIWKIILQVKYIVKMKLIDIYQYY
jgi:hypothetical protein